MGSSSVPLRKIIKPKINFLNVQYELDQVQIFHPKEDAEVVGSKCKACQKTFYGKNLTNLKAYLEKFHPDISKVQFRPQSDFSAKGYGIHPGSILLLQQQPDRCIKCSDNSFQVHVLLLSLSCLHDCLQEEESQKGKSLKLYYDILRILLKNSG